MAGRCKSNNFKITWISINVVYCSLIDSYTTIHYSLFILLSSCENFKNMSTSRMQIDELASGQPLFCSIRKRSYKKKSIKKFKTGISYLFGRICMQSLLLICKEIAYCKAIARISIWTKHQWQVKKINKPLAAPLGIINYMTLSLPQSGATVPLNLNNLGVKILHAVPASFLLKNKTG
jgi:hypothetical protein